MKKKITELYSDTDTLILSEKAKSASFLQSLKSSVEKTEKNLKPETKKNPIRKSKSSRARISKKISSDIDPSKRNILSIDDFEEEISIELKKIDPIKIEIKDNSKFKEEMEANAKGIYTEGLELISEPIEENNGNKIKEKKQKREISSDIDYTLRDLERKFDEENQDLNLKVVMPNPDSEFSIRANAKSMIRQNEEVKFQTQLEKIQRNQKSSRGDLSKSDIEKFVKLFKHQVVKITKTEIVIKHTKYGFEFFYNNTNQQYWIVAVLFDEPYNPSDIAYRTFWTGNAFIGYGYNTLNDLLKNAKTIINSGRLGFISWRDYVVDYDEKNFRVITSNKPKSFTLKEYKKFMKWFTTNKIKIMVKVKGSIDLEDLMLKAKKMKENGERVPSSIMMSLKTSDKPRRASFISAYPVEKKGVKGEYLNPDNKLYQMGFSFSNQ